MSDHVAPRRHILLDFDGVVSAEYYEYRDEPRDLENMARLGIYQVQVPADDASPGGPYQMLVDKAVVARLNTIAALPDVDVFWLTCTGYWAPRLFAPHLGVDSFPNSPHASNIPGQEGAPGSGFRARLWWKAQAALAHLDTGADVLLVDNVISGDLRHHLGMRHDYIDDHANVPSFVKPTTRVGLTGTELDVIEHWARNGGRVFHDTAEIEYEAANARLADENSPLSAYNLD